MELDRKPRTRAVVQEDPLEQVTVHYDVRFFLVFTVKLHGVDKPIVFGLSPSVLPNQGNKRSVVNELIKNVLHNPVLTNDPTAFELIRDVFLKNQTPSTEAFVKALNDLHTSKHLGDYYTHIVKDILYCKLVIPKEVASDVHTFDNVGNTLYNYYHYALQDMQQLQMKKDRSADRIAAEAARQRAERTQNAAAEALDAESYCDVALSQPLFLNFVARLFNTTHLNVPALKALFNEVAHVDMRSEFNKLARNRRTLNFLMDLYIANLCYNEYSSIGVIIKDIKVLRGHVLDTAHLEEFSNALELAFDKFMDRLKNKRTLFWLKQKALIPLENRTDALVEQLVEDTTEFKIAESSSKNRKTKRSRSSIGSRSRSRSPSPKAEATGLDDLISGFNTLKVGKQSDKHLEIQARAKITADGIMHHISTIHRRISVKTHVHLNILYALNIKDTSFALDAKNVTSTNVLNCLQTLLDGDKSITYSKRGRHEGIRKQLVLNWTG